MSRPVRLAPRVEPLLLPMLRERFPGIRFATTQQVFDPPYTFVRLNAEPQGMATPVSQYVRLRVSVVVARHDRTGDWQHAQDVAMSVERAVCEYAARVQPFISAEHDSGPIVLDDSEPKSAYSVVLLMVRAV